MSSEIKLIIKPKGKVDGNLKNDPMDLMSLKFNVQVQKIMK